MNYTIEAKHFFFEGSIEAKHDKGPFLKIISQL